MPNLYGDILSGVAAQITGSVGLAGSANTGDGFAMFEAIHGSAPRIAGNNKANPSGLLLGAIQMLVDIDQKDVAEKIQNAWLKTLEEGVHTYHIFKEGTSKEKLDTKEFADTVIKRLGQKPTQLKPADYSSSIATFNIKVTPQAPAKKELIGIDVFVHAKDTMPDQLASAIQQVSSNQLTLNMITNRGTKVWPNGFPETFCTDHWRCRFKSNDGKTVDFSHAIVLQQMLHQAGLNIIKTENLYLFNGEPGFTAAQGQ